METDPGVPRIIWNSPRSIKVFGGHVLLNGFRFGGHYSKPGGPVKPLTKSNAAYNYDLNLSGFSMPNLSEDHEMWVAVFAASLPKQSTAEIRFVPFLRVSSYNKPSGMMTFHDNVGTIVTNEFFRGADALVVHEEGHFSSTLVHITHSFHNKLILSPPPSLAIGDYVLPSPGPGYDYKYLRSLKLDFSPDLKDTFPCEWRNFVFGEARTYAYIGNPFDPPQIQAPLTANTDWPRPLDFRHSVSPLATGVIVSGQAYRINKSDSDAYLFLGHDAAHTIAAFGVDRVSVAGMGATSNAILCFGGLQTLWASTSHPEVIGTVTLRGWVED